MRTKVKFKQVKIRVTYVQNDIHYYKLLTTTSFIEKREFPKLIAEIKNKSLKKNVPLEQLDKIFLEFETSK